MAKFESILGHRRKHACRPHQQAETPRDTAKVTTHPLLNAQVDLVDVQFKKKNQNAEVQYAWPELKLTTAPQLDLLGCSNGRGAAVSMATSTGDRVAFR